MWTSTLELDPARVIPTKILGTFWRGAYFSSFAPLQVQNLPRQPLPASNWVRMRNSLAGICGSDLHLIFVDGDFNIAPAALPKHSRTYPGHEVVGEIIEVGDDVERLHVGDRVVLQHGPNCITAGVEPFCRSCTLGNYGLCEYGALLGPQPIGGGWSEEMLLHEHQLFRIPPDMDDAQAVLLEPSAVALHAVLRHLPQPDDRVLIVGAGTIGLLILQTIRALAPEAEVDVLARYTFQVERATRMGAAHIIYPQDSYREIQLATGAQLYQGRGNNKMLVGGYDVIYDTVGSKRTVHDSLRWTRAGSTVVLVGLNLHRMHIDLTPIWHQEIKLIGTLGHGTETWPIGTNERKSTFEIVTEMILSGELQPDKLITHSFALNDYRNALLTAVDKGRNRAIKVVFDYAMQPPSVVPNVRAARQRRRALTTGTDAQPLAPRESEHLQPQDIPQPRTPERVPVPPRGRIPANRVPPRHTLDEPLPLPSDMVEDEDDPRTIVVSLSKHARPNQETQSPRNDEDDPRTIVVSTSKRPRFDITSQYGNLPGFHQGLDEMAIPSPETDLEGEEARQTVVVPSSSSSSSSPPSQEASSPELSPLLSSFSETEVLQAEVFSAEVPEPEHEMLTTNPAGDNQDQMLPPPKAEEVTWLQFMISVPERADEDVDDSETQVIVPHKGEEHVDIETPAPQTTIEHPPSIAPQPQIVNENDDATKTVTVLPTKRARQRKRKTDSIKSGEENQSEPTDL